MWAIQAMLDEAATDARRVVEDAHYTGCRVRQESETLELWLFDASSRLVEELEATRPGVYVIHDAPQNSSRNDHALSASVREARVRSDRRNVEGAPVRRPLGRASSSCGRGQPTADSLGTQPPPVAAKSLLLSSSWVR